VSFGPFLLSRHPPPLSLSSPTKLPTVLERTKSPQLLKQPQCSERFCHQPNGLDSSKEYRTSSPLRRQTAGHRLPSETGTTYDEHRVPSSLLGPVGPLFRALSRGLKFTVRHYQTDKNILFLNNFHPGSKRLKAMLQRKQGLAVKAMTRRRLPSE